MIKRGEMLAPDDVLELLAIELIGIVPEDENVVKASNRGTPIALEGEGLAGQAFRNIASRIAGEEVPFIDLEANQGFLDRLGKMIGLRGNA